MYQFILIIHIFTAVCLIAMVLVQQGKGATVGAAFGSGASQTVFGSRGSGSFLMRVTIGFIVIFFATSIVLNYLAAEAIKHQNQLAMPALPEQTGPMPSSIPTSAAPATTATPAVPQAVKPAATTMAPATVKPVVNTVPVTKPTTVVTQPAASVTLPAAKPVQPINTTKKVK